MNVRLIRNALFTAVLCAAAVLVPPKKAEAQTLSQCQINCYIQYGECYTVSGDQALCTQWLNSCLATC